MNYSQAYFLIVFTIIVEHCYSLSQIDWNETINGSLETNLTIEGEDIYKCVSYTAAHIDISHWINQDFSYYKDCQTSGLYILNERDRYFTVDIDVQRSWIVDVSAILYNGTLKPICGINSVDFFLRPTGSCKINGVNVIVTETDRFDILSLYYDIGNLTIITTHNKQGLPPHLNVNIWQKQLSMSDSYGLCTSSTCNSDMSKDLLIDHAKSSYSDDIIQLICDIYIDNYLNSTQHQVWERSLHYNSTIENARKACISDVKQTDWPHSAVGSIEVLFVEDQVNSENITSIADIQKNFQRNLEDKLLKLAETIDVARVQVDNMLQTLTTLTSTVITVTTTITITKTTTILTITSLTTIVSTPSMTKQTNGKTLAIIIGCSLGGLTLLIASIVGVYCYMTKIVSKYPCDKKVSDSSVYMNELR